MNFDINLYAEINKIDCHSSAIYGKISGIPSANICMNCHLSITEYQVNYFENGKNKNFYNGEIKKIYQAVGWKFKQ